MSNGKYYFNTSDSGCELCEAMEGWYDDEPPRPHPHCDCSIETVEENDADIWRILEPLIH